MFPYVEVAGSHAQMGMQLGQALRQQIRKQLVVCDAYYRQEYRKGIKELHIIARKFLPYAERAFPQYGDELRGLATGSGVAFDDLLVVMCEEEIVAILIGRIPEKCTSIAARWRNSYVLAHNEDYVLIYQLYIVKARPEKEPSFLSLAYMGALGGSSSALNPFIAFSGNSIECISCRYGVPKNFLLRAMCAQQSEEDVIRLWNTHPRTVGNNSMFVTKDGIYDIEATPDRTALSREQHLFFHTNHLLHPMMKGTPEAPTASSLARYARLKEIFTPKKKISPVSLRAVLADHQAPICRHTGPSQTLATIIMDVRKQSMLVYEGKLCKKKRKRFTL
ncbi:hypothetical protein HY639_02560 [Candidatus Woesearchaeota archaeon]|nr:hypothetical protein [Candidatus Woesearchaeota archaeon]